MFNANAQFDLTSVIQKRRVTRSKRGEQGTRRRLEVRDNFC